MGGPGIRASELGRWLAAFLFMAAAAVWLATADFPLIDSLQFVSSEERAVSSGHELVQTFTATGENISRVDLVLVKTPAGPSGELELRIFEASEVQSAETSDAGAAPPHTPLTGETLAETTLDMDTFDYSSIRRLEFEPVTVTPGRLYAFSLTSDVPETAAIEPGANPKDEYAGGSLYIDSRPAEGDLYFAIFRSAGAGEMLNKMEPWRPFPLDSVVLVFAMFVAGAGAFGWLLWSVAGNRGDPEPEVPTPPGASAGVKPPPAGPAAP